ncbi:TPA_asm: UL50.5 sORF 1 [Human alphaherpesvirus 1]|nr:TPA_asm: UL50.5 sORF 1 [Human alphaherpesvirus 1]
MSRNVTSTRRVPGANSRVLLGATTTAITVPRYPESIRPSITWCPGLASAGA